MGQIEDGFVIEICSECRVEFGMRQRFQERMRANSRLHFYCPNGHCQYYSAEATEREKLRRERDRLAQEAARLQEEMAKGWARAAEYRQERDAETRRVSAAKGRITKMKNREASGVCPCCDARFMNLAQHMKSKHIDYVDEPIDLEEGAPAQ